jgi:hypothetical protein
VLAGEFGGVDCELCAADAVDHDGDARTACQRCPADFVVSGTLPANCTACLPGTTTDIGADFWSLFDRGLRCRPVDRGRLSTAQLVGIGVGGAAMLAFVFICVVRCSRRARVVDYGSEAPAGVMQLPLWLRAVLVSKLVDRAVGSAQQARIVPRPKSAQLAHGPYIGSARPDGRALTVDANGRQAAIGRCVVLPGYSWHPSVYSSVNSSANIAVLQVRGRQR